MITFELSDRIRQALNDSEATRELIALLNGITDPDALYARLASMHPSIEAVSGLISAAPSNTYPLDAFLGEASTTVTAPTTGVYIARYISTVNTDTGVMGGGSFLSNAILGNFTVNATPTGGACIHMPDFGTDPSPFQTWACESRLTVNQGDTIGFVFGFLAARAETITMSTSRTLSIEPTI